MKNGRAMRGHRRVLAMCGVRPGKRQRSTGGWDVGCICGWDGGNWDTATLARKVYRVHLDEMIDATPRICRVCGETKPAQEMAGRYSRHVCRRCYSDAGNAWQREHPEAAARHKKNYHLLVNFGIGLDEYERMLADQHGCCALCDDPITDDPHVDHDHATGIVRAILCFRCNVGLSSFFDSPDRLRAAIRYLERYL